jgi:anti-sigma factor (TIGR02949 family)
LTTPPPYDCREAFRRIHDYLDRELAPAEIGPVRAHLEVCAVCAREFRFEAQVIDEFRARLRRVSVPADFKSRLLASLRDPRGSRDGDAPR